jgi:hypothetical protein
MNDIVLTDALGVPKPAPRNAQMSVKIVFWYNPKTDHILQGAPEQFDPIYGYQKIVCNHAHEAESWSARLTAQDKRIAEMNDYERECVEAPMRANLRAEIRAKLADPSPGGDARRKSINHAMLRRALEELDKQEANGKTVRESYLHVEAFEHGN